MMYLYLFTFLRGILSCGNKESVLNGLTTDLLSETPKSIADLERRLKGVAKLTAQQQKNLAIYTVGIALTLALIKQGWSVHTSIGETVVLSQRRPFDQIIYNITSVDFRGFIRRRLAEHLRGIRNLEL